MNTIADRQNDERNFQLKLCFRYLYDRAKIFYNINLSISLLIPVVALIFKILKLEYKDFILAVSSSWIIISMILNILEQNLRLKAVTLQERYDISVLGLKENKTIMFKKISIEEISFIVKKMRRKKIDRIYYDGIECSDNTMALLLAQRQNIFSDRILRGRYCFIYKFFLFSILMLSVFLAIFLEQTVKEFLIEILIPLISLISFLIQQIKKLSEEITRNEQIGELIERDFLKLSKINQENITEQIVRCREYQNYIFTRRLNAALIPNFIYRLFHNSQIDGNEIIQTLSSEIRNIK